MLKENVLGIFFFGLICGYGFSIVVKLLLVPVGIVEGGILQASRSPTHEHKCQSSKGEE